MSDPLTQDLPDESATIAFGRRLGEACGAVSGATLFLRGELGAGKTTLCRGFLRSFGHHGAVKSPTYTLVEPYEFAGRAVYHFDLYRLGDPEELEFLGIRDYFSENSLCLVEWAEKGVPFLPAADIVASIAPVTTGRAVTVTAHTATGERIVSELRR